MIQKMSFLLCFLCGGFVSAQKITPQVIASAGDVQKANNISIEWTLGELATETLNANNLKITQGFHQANLTVVSTENPTLEGISVYPSPVSSTLTVKNAYLKTLQLTLTNIQGVEISKKSSNQNIIDLDLNQLPAGHYILIAKDKNVQQSFKIEKIN